MFPKQWITKLPPLPKQESFVQIMKCTAISLVAVTGSAWRITVPIVLGAVKRSTRKKDIKTYEG